jgi:hypothetical protein
MRLGVIQQQEAALRKQSGSTAIGQESEGANADKAVRENGKTVYVFVSITLCGIPYS